MSVIENNKEPRWRLTWIDDAKKVKKPAKGTQYATGGGL
jgi:hypothetical protein